MSRFIINDNNHDFLSNIEKTIKRIGDVGEVSQQYKDAAFHGLSDEVVQDDFMEENRLQRMQYKIPGRQDDFDNSHGKVGKEVHEKTELTVDSIRNAFKNPEYMIDNTETIVSSEIIKK
jgi:hypothetical protein